MSDHEGRGDLADLEAFQAALLAAVPGFILRTDAERRVISVNRYGVGFTPENTLGRNVIEFLPPASHARANEAFDHVQATGEVARYEAIGPRATGGEGVYTTYVAPVAQPDGRRGLCLCALDTTEAHRREHALRETTDQLALARALSGLGLWSLDLKSGAVTWDPRMSEIMGTEAALAPGEYLQFVHPEDRAAVERAQSETFARRQWVAVPHRIIRRSDGAIRWVITNGAYVYSAEGEAASIVGGSLDVTEQHLHHEHRHHRQKLEAVGSLAAGIAHNFNNMLAVITPVLELIRGELPARSVPLVDDASDAARRAAEMVRQLLTFAGRSRRSEPQPTAVTDVIARAITLCRQTFDRHISLELELEPELGIVRTPDGELEQVLVNLLLNARDAVLAAGRPSPWVRVSASTIAAADGDPPKIRIQVSDNGTGMTKGVLARAFEPFFTTKDVGSGTGLGLAISYAIARDHGGSLDVESQPGEGATFTLAIPLATPAAVSPPKDAPPPATLAGCRVLVIDDEQSVRSVTRRVLERAGASVIEASSARDALRALEAADTSVDVMLLDRSMPGEPGELAVPRLRAAAPRAKIFLFTGQGVEERVAALADGIVAKPFASADLLAIIKAALGR